MPGQAVSNVTVDAVRRFSRFYTRIVGALDQGYLDSPYSLAELRLLFELSNRDAPTAAMLMRDLDRAAGRESHLSLRAAGRAGCAELDGRPRADVADLLAPLGRAAQQTLVDAMARIRALLGDEPDRARAQAPIVVLRAPNPGDLGWIV